MIYRYTPSLHRIAFSLHDCIATNMTWDNDNLTFFFPDGILLGEELSPKERFDDGGHEG